MPSLTVYGWDAALKENVLKFSRNIQEAKMWNNAVKILFLFLIGKLK